MSNVNNGVLKEGRMQTFLGKMTAYQRDGESILRGTTPTQVNNPQTAAQMYHRLRLPNLVAFYRVARKFNKKGWENLPAKTSLYNCFVGANMDVAPLGIRKGDFGRGMTLVEGYQVTQGSLPSIVVDTQSYGTAQGVTDIRVGSLESISSSTKIGDLAKAIVESNGGAYLYGDEIAFLLCEQFWNDGVALVRSKRTAITLFRDSQETLGDMSLKGFGIVDGKIGIQGSAPLGGYCWVHSRKDEWNDKLRVSTQRIVVVNDMVLQIYRQPEQMRKAAEDQGAKFDTTALLECHSSEDAAILSAFGLQFEMKKNGADGDALQATIVCVCHGEKMLANGMPGIYLSNDKKLEIVIGNAELIDESSMSVSVNGVRCEATAPVHSTLSVTLAQSLDGQVLESVEIESDNGKVSAMFK